MNNQLEYETPICNLRRLVSEDKSDKFKLNVVFKNLRNATKVQDQNLTNTNKLEIDTTINKIRSISSKINTMYQIDPTITEYELTIPKQGEEDEHYKKNVKDMIDALLDSTMKKVEISDEHKSLFSKIRFLLGSSEEDNKIEFEFSNEEEAISYLCTEMHDKSIEYLSIHFSEMIEHGNYKHFDESIMREIIDYHFQREESNENENAKEDEDEDEKKKKFEAIFNKMKAEYESPKMILSILLRINASEYNDDMYWYIYEHLDDEMIESEFSQIINIVRRFLFDHIYKWRGTKEKKEDEERIQCEYQGNELSGIIRYLKGNKSEEETLNEEIKLSGGGGIHSDHPIINLIKYDSNHINDRYYNDGHNYKSPKESWIEFDFKEKQINLTSYTIRSNGSSPNSHAHPKTWTISGSKDGRDWTIIDKQDNNPVLNGEYKQHRFEIQNNNNEYYRYIRYHQDDSWDKNKDFQYAVNISCIEFFGSIITSSNKL